MKQRIHILGASGSGTTTITTVKCPVIEVVNYDLENSVEQVMLAIEE